MVEKYAKRRFVIIKSDVKVNFKEIIIIIIIVIIIVVIIIIITTTIIIIIEVYLEPS